MSLKSISGKDVNLSRAFKDIKVDFARNPFTQDVSQVSNDNAIKPVSYTHLTLPTILLV